MALQSAGVLTASSGRSGKSKCVCCSASPLAMPFPAAAQPDIIRASQKDGGYKYHVSELFQDAARRILGPRRAIICSSELDLISGLVYYVLTTGCGTQTLGEEYCDILQTAGLPGREPSVRRRLALVVLDSLGPYLAEKVQQSGAPGQSTWSRQQPVTDNLMAVAAAVLPWALRLHLSLFYLYGIYYEWPKRLTGTRHQFLGKLLERRPSYRVLGVLMTVQLATSAAFWGLSHSLPALKLFGSDDEHHHLAARELRVASVLEEEKYEPPLKQSAHRCPLCLSQRDCPTATPCGHVFCWACISAWANQKPECPLCRSPVLGSDLVRVHHADF